MIKSLKREIKIFFLMPKNIYLPLSIFGIIFVIFLVMGIGDSFNYTSSFIASFITIFIISEGTFKEDYTNGYLEQKLCEGDQLNMTFYLASKWITNLIFVFAPIAFLSLVFQSQQISIKIYCVYMIMLSTIYFFFNLGSAISLKRNNSLNAILIIPLLIPFIILIKGIFVDGNLQSNIWYLFAYFVFSATFIFYTILKILKIQIR